MSWIQQIDFMILEWIQSHLQGAALDLLMPLITALGNGGWLFILLALVLLLSKRYRRQGCALAVSLLLCLLVGNLFLKPLFALYPLSPVWVMVTGILMAAAVPVFAVMCRLVLLQVQRHAKHSKKFRERLGRHFKS